MSQFKFEIEMNNLVSMDGPLTKGPPPRWQRKRQELYQSTTIHHSLNLSNQQKFFSTSMSKTPTKNWLSDVIKTKKTPSKTPCKNRSNSSTTPTPNKNAKTPVADRFIPVRSASKFDIAHYKLNQDENFNNSTQKKLQKAICENFYGSDIESQNFFSYTNKLLTAPPGIQNPNRVIHTQAKISASIKTNTRYIPHAPDRILDAPDIVDDYYLNLIDWNAGNVLAVALGAHVYLWNASTGNTEVLLELQGNDYVCSISWVQEGDYLAVGTTNGTVEIWDCTRVKRLRVMDGHSARVGSLCWNSYVLSSGCRSGKILHHDVRQPDHVITTLSGHSQEVCGLKWSPDGRYLASGGNDNILNIWQSVSGRYHTNSQPLHVFTAHQAAVKALSWCPWQPHVLASGGGTTDHHIRFWNCNIGSCVSSVDTKTQVCAVLWSSIYKEIISGHGFPNNELIIWKYPAMTKVAELTGHTARILHLAMSPDGSTVLSAGADETLRLWKCFVKNSTETKTGVQVREKPSVFKQCIR